MATSILKEDLIQEQILKAAQHLFEKHGYQKVTVDDVARYIGKGRSTLYYYYKNKDEIFNAVMDFEIDEIMAELSGAVDQRSTLEDKIQAFCSIRTVIARRRKSFFQAMEDGMNSDEMSEYMKKKLAIHRRLIREESNLLKKVITFGIEKGELPFIEEKKIETVILILLCSLRGLKLEMTFENDFTRMDKAINTLTHMTIQGLK